MTSELLERLVASGVNSADLTLLAARVAYIAAFDLLMAIDEGADPDGRADLPGWRLMETDHIGTLTGRVIGSVHESLIETDPSGTEARDLLG